MEMYSAPTGSAVKNSGSPKAMALPRETNVPVDHVFDLSQIQQIFDASDGDLAFIEEVMVVFEDSTRRCLGQLKEAVTLGSFEQAKRIAHQIKGAAANVGAYQLARHSTTLELLCTGSLQAACLQQEKILSKEFMQFSKLLEQIRSKRVSLGAMGFP